MSETRRATILNVNDREPNRYAVSRILKAAGFNVVEAENGAAALEQARKLPDLVVLDVNLPDMSGFEVARRIKEEVATSHILILHVSAISVFARHRAEGLERGADGYLTEPFEPEELIATINALLRLGRAETTARAAAQEWQVTFDALGEGIAMVDSQGRIGRHNAALGRLFAGGPNGNLAGQTLSQLFAADRSLTSAFEELGRNRTRHYLELEREGRTFRVTLDPLEVQGAPTGAIAAVEEITQLKRAETALRFLSDSSEILMASLDYEQTLKRVASAVVPALGDFCLIDLREAEGALRRVASAASEQYAPEREALEALLPDPDRSDLVIERALFKGEATLLAEITDRDLDSVAQGPGQRELFQRIRARSIIAVPLMVRERVFGAMTLISAGGRGRYSQEELDLAKELARRVATAVENARLHREAQLAIHTRDEFFSIASHELKNPLSALLLQLKLLQRELRRSPARPLTLDTFGNKVDAAERNASRLGELVQELLDTTRIRAGRLELRPEPVDLAGLVRDVVQRFESQANAAETPVEVGTQADVVGEWDRSRVEQVVVNLVSNAIKYGGGKPVRIEVVQRDGAARLTIRDQGIGIPPADQERVFEPFERARTAGTTGLGLGLYISRKIIEAHGGAIVLESQPGQGTTFTVTLPARAVSAAATAG